MRFQASAKCVRAMFLLHAMFATCHQFTGSNADESAKKAPFAKLNAESDSALPWLVSPGLVRTGSYGVFDGDVFEAGFTLFNLIKSITVRSDSVVNSITVSFTIGRTKTFGGSGGATVSKATFSFGDKEELKSIEFYINREYGASGGFRVVTNLQTAEFGPLTGERYPINFVPDAHAKLMAIKGRQGDYIYSLGFDCIFTDLPSSVEFPTSGQVTVS